MGTTVIIAIGAAILVALLIADLLLDWFIIRSVFRLIDRLPPYRSGGRYHSQATPEKYSSLRKPPNGN